MKPDLIFRVDGDEQIGLGHIYRMYALAKILKDWFNSTFYIQEPSPSIIQMIEGGGFRIFALPKTDRKSNAFYQELHNTTIKKNDIVVLDGYHFDARYQQELKSLDCKLISIDDIYATTFYADAVINHIGGLTENRYSSGGNTSFYLGPDYAILRPAFLVERPAIPAGSRINRLMITLGGADSNNVTMKILQTLEPHLHEFSTISVVIGSAYRFEDELRTYIQPRENIKVLKNISEQEMYETMYQSGMAICSASTVSYEYAAVSGLLFITQTADNQKDLYKYLLEGKLGLPLEKMTEVITAEKKEDHYIELSARQREILDGRSGKRLLSVFLKVYTAGNIRLRKTEENDLITYFNWANDPESRQNSFSADPISIDDHTVWFKNKLKDQHARLYVLESGNGIPIGNIRFELKEGEYVLSYFIDENFRQLGLAKQLLEIGIDQFFQESPSTDFVTGFIKEGNQPSVRAFSSVGFEAETNSKEGILKYKKTKKHV